MTSEANITRKYLNLVTLSNSQSNIDRDKEEVLTNFLLLPIKMHLVFERFKVSLFAFSHRHCYVVEICIKLVLQLARFFCKSVKNSVASVQ